MKGNTKISAIAIAAALGTLMVTSHGASARSFSTAMPGSNVQVDWGVLEQLGNSQTDTRDRSLSSRDTNQRIRIDSQLLIYPQTPPKSRFLAPQLLLSPPSDSPRFETGAPNSRTDIGDLETVVIDGAGVIPTDDAPQSAQERVILRPPVERVQLRAPVSFPARPAVEQITRSPAPVSARTTGNLGGPLASDIADDGAPQVIHLVRPVQQPAPISLDDQPRPKDTTMIANATNVSAVQNMQVAVPATAPTPAPAPATKPASLLAATPATPPASNAAKPVQIADNATSRPKVVVPAAPEITEPHLDTTRETPKNKMAVPPVKTVPLPDKNAAKPVPKPKDTPSVGPVPLKKENAVPTSPAPTPDTTTSPQKMLDQQSRAMPKPPAPKPAVKKADPLPEPRQTPKPQQKSQLQPLPRETASAPVSQVMDKPKAVPAAGGDYSLPFSENSFELDNSTRKSLDAIVGMLAKNEDLRVQLQAYAAGESQNASKARRLSLSRALQVRSYLIDSGVRSTRIDVRALGANVPSGPADRVDVKTVQR